jgi:hypothetical protein
VQDAIGEIDVPPSQREQLSHPQAGERRGENIARSDSMAASRAAACTCSTLSTLNSSERLIVTFSAFSHGLVAIQLLRFARLMTPWRITRIFCAVRCDTRASSSSLKASTSCVVMLSTGVLSPNRGSRSCAMTFR